MDPAVHTWNLAAGGEVEGSLVAYSLQSRIITLELTNGKTVHLGPRDLTAISKLKWLASPAFMDALKRYSVPKDVELTIASNLAAPVIGSILGAFLAFWMAASMVMGNKRITRAVGSFAICVGYFLLVTAITGFALHAISSNLGDSPVAPLMHAVALSFGLVAMAIILSCRIGSDYGESGIVGLGTLSVALINGLILATITVYLLPRFLEAPGIDDWFTDRLLAPLGLA
ncbi:MAG: hypothetical protein KDN19_20775 [Verrucomicrobiae bacterium]|nr:hypothetical protein [Verrucomicrobiae bacterium]